MDVEQPHASSVAALRKLAKHHEIKGLALVTVVGIALIALLVLAIRFKAERLRAQRLAEASAQPAPAIAVDALIVATRPLVDSLRLPGLVRPWMEAEIAAEVSGRVLERKVLEGSPVQAGETLLLLEPSDYRINLDRSRAALALAQETYRRTAELVKQNVKPQQELDRDENALLQAKAAVAAAELALARCEIRSPFAGVVEEIIPEVGEFLSPGTKVARLLDVRKVKVDVAIPEQDINAVQELKKCDLRLSAQGDVCLQGERLQLGLAPLREALVYRLQLAVDNAEGLLRPGMFVEADVVRSRKEAVVMVPIFAVMPADPGYAVYVVEDAGEPLSLGKARRRAVTLGVMQGQEVEIRQGLKPGELLIVRGQRYVEDGATVRLGRIVKEARALLR